MSGWVNGSSDWFGNPQYGQQQIANAAASAVAPTSPILGFILGKVLGGGAGGAFDDGPSENPFTGSSYADPFTTEADEDPFTTGIGYIEEVISVGDGAATGEISSDAQAAFGDDGPSPSMLSSPDLLAQNDAAPANANVASDTTGPTYAGVGSLSVNGQPWGWTDFGQLGDGAYNQFTSPDGSMIALQPAGGGPVVIVSASDGSVLGALTPNGNFVFAPIDIERPPPGTPVPADFVPAPGEMTSTTTTTTTQSAGVPAPPPIDAPLTSGQEAQSNAAIQQAVGASGPGPVDTGQPTNINDVLAGTDLASLAPAQDQPPASPPGSGTVPFNPMADSPFASWLLYRGSTPILDALTNDSNLRAAQNASLALATSAATVATAGAILEAAPGIAAGVQSFFATAATGVQSLSMSALPLGAGAIGMIATNPALQQEIGDELETLPALSNEVGALATEVEALAPESEENLASTGEQALTKFQDIVRQAQAFLNANKDLIMKLGGSSRGAPISPHQLSGAIGQYANGNPGFARALGGNAMEALVNAIVEDLPQGEGSFLQISGPNRIDFIGTGAFEGYAFELTTEAGVIGHAVRAYMQLPGAMIITYPPIID